MPTSAAPPGAVPSVIVPLDESSYSESAFAIGQNLALVMGGNLLLLTVATPEDSSAAASHLAALADQVRGIHVTTKVVPVESGRSVADQILDESAQRPGALVCISAHGRGVVASTVLGSTTNELLRASDKPVFVVGPNCRQTWPLRNWIVVPLAQSAGAEDILSCVHSIATKWFVTPRLLHVAPPRARGRKSRTPPALQQASDALTRMGTSAVCNERFTADTSMAIADEATLAGASLVVMSSHMRRGVSRALLGSVTAGVVHNAPCPVLVCPPVAGADQPEDPADAGGDPPPGNK